MPDSILKIILRVTKEGTGNKELEREAKELKGALSELGLGSLASVSALGLLSGAVMGAAAFTKAAVDETVKYAGEIKNLSQITGQSAEETSRVVQVLDDFKLTTDDLTKAQKALAKDGLSLNIETLARLSDEYQKLGSGAEKSQFLLDKFGKTGFAFADAMSKGGNALREMSGEIDNSLIMTQEAIDAAEEYRLNIDKINDSWMGLKITLGNAVIPVINSSITAWENWSAAMDDAEKATGRTDQRSKIMYASMISDMREMEYATNSSEQSYTAMAKAFGSGADGIKTGADAVELSKEALKEQEEALKAATKANQAYLGLVGDFTSQYADQNQKMADIDAERKQIEADLALARSQGWWEGSEKIQGYKEKLAELQQAEIEEGETAKLKMREKILTMLETKLAIDGLDETETNYLLDLGLKWGVYSQEAVTAAKNAYAEIKMLADQIITLPDGKRITIEVFTQMTGYAGYGAGASYATNDLKYQQPSRDSGGIGMPGQEYLIGTGAQPERFVPDTKGTFYPAGSGPASGGSGGGAMDVNVNLKLNSDAESLLTPVVTRIVRRLN